MAAKTNSGNNDTRGQKEEWIQNDIYTNKLELSRSSYSQTELRQKL